MTRTRRTLLTATACLVPAAAGLAFIVPSGQATQTQDAASRFRDVLQHISAFAVEETPAESLYVKAARGLIDQLDDPYAALYSPEEIARFSREQIGNAYGGLGMVVEDQRDAVVINRIYPHTPAEGAGLQVGDRLVQINGEDVQAERVEGISRRLLGQPGSEVQVSVARLGVPGLITIKARRAMVHVPAVPFAMMLEGGVGYVPLQQFSQSAPEEMEQALLRLKAAGARSYVLDLRGNGGGDLDVSVDISGLFLRAGQSVVSVAHRGRPVQVARARGQSVVGDAPVVVLTDGYTASASEIVAGSLQDHDRGLVVGTTSYGKGVVQTVYPLEGGWAMKLTTGKWMTPSGRSIQRPHPKNGVAQTAPDSLETDSVRKTRPAFRSDGGRVVYGGGGITPDVIVPAETLSTAEQGFFRAVAPQSTAFRVALSRYANELRATAKPNFTVEPAWRDEFYRRLTAAGVPVTREVYDAAAPAVSRMLERRVATAAFGDSAAFRREAGYDPQLTRALTLVRQSRSQPELLARANEKREKGE